MNIPNLRGDNAKISELAESMKILSDRCWASIVDQSMSDDLDWDTLNEARAKLLHDLNESTRVASHISEEDEPSMNTMLRSFCFSDALVDMCVLMDLFHVKYEDLMLAIEIKLKELDSIANSCGNPNENLYDKACNEG